MRKRKTNPSLEAAAGLREISVVLGGDVASESQEIAEVASQLTGLQDCVQVPTSKAHTIEVDVAAGVAVRPPRNEGVGATLDLVEATELAPTGETVLTPQERVLADRLVEEEAYMAGDNLADPHWFWEVLEQAGYDVW